MSLEEQESLISQLIKEDRSTCIAEFLELVGELENIKAGNRELITEIKVKQQDAKQFSK